MYVCCLTFGSAHDPAMIYGMHIAIALLTPKRGMGGSGRLGWVLALSSPALVRRMPITESNKHFKQTARDECKHSSSHHASVHVAQIMPSTKMHAAARHAAGPHHVHVLTHTHAGRDAAVRTSDDDYNQFVLRTSHSDDVNANKLCLCGVCVFKWHNIFTRRR